MIILLGEVGGTEEYKVCDAIKNGEITKPLVAWCIGKKDRVRGLRLILKPIN